MAASSERLPGTLALSDDGSDTLEPAAWAGPLVVLGSRASRYARMARGQQIIIVVSLPRRDFAAALIGCGWVMASDASSLPSTLEFLRSARRGDMLRFVNEHNVIVGPFWSLDESAHPARAHIGGSTWQTDKFKAVVILPGAAESGRTDRPKAGSIGRMAQLDKDWDARLAKPAADLAIVGTVAWLREDFSAFLSRGVDAEPTLISDLLLTDLGRVATWFTRVYSSSGFADRLPLPDDIRAVVLDGSAAMRYVTDIEAPVVFCVIDRSVSDETAAEIIVQLRNTHGEAVALRDDLRWQPPYGVEAMAFTVAL